VRIPFRSGNEVVNAVLSGSTPVAILALSNMVPQLQSGHITPLVVTGKTRSPLFPDIPTLAEVRGGENYPATWFGLFAPADTPKPIIARLAHEVARIVDERDFRQRMYIDRAVEPSGIRLQEFARFATSARSPNKSSESRACSRSKRAEKQDPCRHGAINPASRLVHVHQARPVNRPRR
jgi:tripartite-type tricarboxylate transporter receptor subunit TctC